MKRLRILLVVCAVQAIFAAAILPAKAATEQIGDFRLNSNVFTGGFTYFDPGFGSLGGGTPLTTRGVMTAPAAARVNSDFSGTSQNPGDAAPDSATDIGLQTYSVSTVIRTLNRYASDPDGDGGAGGAQRVGIVRWNFDLSPLDTYLTDNSLSLTALDLDLVTDPSDDAKEYDVYLSYTNAAESITQTEIDAADAGVNYNTFWLPSQSSTEGSIVGGTHKVLALDQTGDLTTGDLSESLLSLFDAGVRDFNLIMTSAAFLSSRSIGILEGSGLSIDTGDPGVIPGDFTENGIVDSDDFSIWQSNFGTLTGMTHGQGDADDDTDVDGNDFLIWQRDFGIGAGDTAMASAVIPEPSCLGLLLLTAVTAAAIARRKRSAE